MRYVTLTLNTILAIVICGVVAFLIAPRLGLVSPYEMKIVRSGSMSPLIPTGSVVLIQPSSEYAVGDVITFGADTRTSIPTSHRIIGERVENGSTYYTTKGDANDDPDPSEVTANKIIGRIVFSVPVVGYILAFSKTQLGFALLVLIPATLVILYELLGIWQEVKALRKRKRDDRAVARLASESRVVHTPLLRRATVAPRLLHFDIESPIVI